jgi:pimeloyl-ACP methyl ester carboxylesterase
LTVSTNRPTVLLLHSSASSPRQWQDMVDALRHEFRVLAVEFHGHGLRPDWAPSRPMTLADDAALAVSLLEMSGGAHLVGHSYGAAVALKIAAQYPRLVRSVTGYEPVLFRLLVDDSNRRREAQEVLAFAQSIRERVDQGESHLAAKIFIEFWSGASAWQGMTPVRQQAVALRMPSVVRHFDALLAEPFPSAQMAHLGIPMLFLSGGRTVPTGRRISQCLRAALPLVEHEELQGLGHMGPITHPAQVNQRVRRFLRTQEGFATTATFARPQFAASFDPSNRNMT